MAFIPIPIDDLPSIEDNQKFNANSVIQNNGVTFKGTIIGKANNNLYIAIQAQFEDRFPNLELTLGDFPTVFLLGDLIIDKPIKLGTGTGIKFIAEGANITITYTGTGAMFQPLNPGDVPNFVEIENVELVGDFPNNSVIDVECVDRVIFENVTIKDFERIGETGAPKVHITNTSASNIINGLVIRNPSSLFIDIGELDNGASAFLTTFFSIITNVVTFATMNNLSDRTTFPNNSLVFIDPNSLSGSRYIVNDSRTIAGKIFQSMGNLEAISSVADNGSGKAQFTTALAHGVTVGTVVSLIGFPEPAFITYNVTGVVTAVDTPGSGTMFEIDKITFIGTSTGTLDKASIDSTDVRVKGLDNQGVLDSKNQAVVNVAGNTTSFIPGTSLGPFDFGTSAVAGNAMQRWELVSSQTARVRYIGQDPFQGPLATIVNIAASSGKDYNIALVKDPDGAATVITESGDIPISAPMPIPLAGGVEAVNGDEFELQIEVDSGTDSIIAPEMTFVIKE